MKTNIARHERFIEKDFWYHKILRNSPNFTIQQVNQVLDGMQQYWHDYTFSFYESGLVKIYDNIKDKEVEVRDLDDVSRDFYIRKRFEQIGLNKRELDLATV